MVKNSRAPKWLRDAISLLVISGLVYLITVYLFHWSDHTYIVVMYVYMLYVGAKVNSIQETVER